MEIYGHLRTLINSFKGLDDRKSRVFIPEGCYILFRGPTDEEIAKFASHEGEYPIRMVIPIAHPTEDKFMQTLSFITINKSEYAEEDQNREPTTIEQSSEAGEVSSHSDKSATKYTNEGRSGGFETELATSSGTTNTKHNPIAGW